MAQEGQGAASAALTGGTPAQDNNPSPNPDPKPSGDAPAFDYKTSIAPEWHETWNKKGWTNPNDVLKSYANLENMMGATDRLILPKDDNDEKAWGEIYTKMGRPATPADYKFEDVPEGVTRNEDVNKWFANTAHQLGLSQKQAAALEKNWNVFGKEMEVKFAAMQAEETKRHDEELRREWGAKYDDNLGLARNAAAKLGGEKIAAAIDALANQAGYTEVIKMFNNLAKGMGEANFVSGDSKTQGAGAGMNPESARKEIDRLMSDPDYLSPSKNPARHKELNDQVTKLFESAYPEDLQKKGTSYNV